MKTETTATVLDGALELDAPLELPNRSRVRVAVEPLENWRARFEAGLNEWKAYCEQHPVHSGRQHFTRDELHERR
jgi:hypothetical protein